MTEQPYEFVQREDLNLVMWVAGSTYNHEQHSHTSIRDGLDILNSLEKPAYYLANSTKWQFNFAELLAASGDATLGDDPLLGHKNILEILLVDSRPLSASVAEGWSSEAFGSLKVKHFDTEEKAIAYIKQQSA